MALLTVTGEPASRWEDVARGAADLLGFELVTETRLNHWMAQEFGEVPIPPRVWRFAALSTLAGLAAQHHLVLAVTGAEALFDFASFTFLAGVTAALPRRVGNVMLDRGVDKAAAQHLLTGYDTEDKCLRKARSGRAVFPKSACGLLLNAGLVEVDQMAEILRAAVVASGLREKGLLPGVEAAQVQFQTRLRLSRHGIVPAGRASVQRTEFSHPSEELFANLLDFYRIAWQYEPRSFPLQWDKNGKVMEAFAPDFYLPEFDLYIELTTMKQALVTRKNRKIKRLRAIYPHVNIQVFYQKDFQDLVFKYGLRTALP